MGWVTKSNLQCHWKHLLIRIVLLLKSASNNHSMYSKMTLLYNRRLKKPLLSFQRAMGLHEPTESILPTQQQRDIPRLVNSLDLVFDLKTNIVYMASENPFNFRFHVSRSEGSRRGKHVTWIGHWFNLLICTGRSCPHHCYTLSFSSKVIESDKKKCHLLFVELISD